MMNCCCFDHIIIGNLIWFYLHKLHLANHLRNALYLLLMAQQIHKEIEVFKRVLSLVEKRLDVGIDSFVDLSMMVLLGDMNITS